MIYALSFLMVSTVKYYSFKKAGFFKKMNFNMLVVVVMFFIIVAAEPSISLFAIMLGYVLSGPFTTLWLRSRKQQGEEADAETVKTPHEKRI